MGLIDQISEAIDGHKLIKSIENLTEQVVSLHRTLLHPSPNAGPPALQQPTRAYSLRVPLGTDFRFPSEGRESVYYMLQDIAIDLAPLPLPDSSYSVTLSARADPQQKHSGFAFRFRPLAFDAVATPMDPLTIHIAEDPDAPPVARREAAPLAIRTPSVVVVVTALSMQVTAWNDPCLPPGGQPLSQGPFGPGPGLRRARPVPFKR